MKRMVVVLLALVAAGCGNHGSTGSPGDSIAVSVGKPLNGATVVIPDEFPYHEVGGVVLPKGSNVMSVSVQMTSAQDVPWAQLNVYLLTDATGVDYCGQNLPDSPSWRSLTRGWTSSVTITGFQVTLPCHVTGVRAMLHTRNNDGLLTPPSASETIVEARAQADFQLTR